MVGFQRRQPVLKGLRRRQFARHQRRARRNEQHLARHSAGVEMARRSRPEAQGKPSPSDEWARGAHATAAGHDGGRAAAGPEAPAATATAYASAAGPSVSRIVLSPMAHRPRRASPAAATWSMSAISGGVKNRRTTRPKAGLDQRSAIEGPGCAANCRDEAVSNRPKDISRRRVGRQLARAVPRRTGTRSPGCRRDRRRRGRRRGGSAPGRAGRRRARARRRARRIHAASTTASIFEAGAGWVTERSRGILGGSDRPSVVRHERALQSTRPARRARRASIADRDDFLLSS